jgi:RNA polymerase sigma-B factor
MRTSRIATDEDIHAAELIAALAALAPDSPARPALRTETIAAWLPMAQRLSRRYARRGEPNDDLEQTAAVGLIKAIDRFDPALGADFVGFAIPTILGEIKRYFRDRSWSVRIPRRLQERNMEIGRARAELGQTLNRAPTVADVATHLGLTEEEVLEGLEGGYAYRAVSLSTPVGDSTLQLGDMLGGEDPGYELVDFTASLPRAMGWLTDREKQIITLRFYGNLTQTAIAERLDISQMHVSRLLAKALGKLRTHLD